MKVTPSAEELNVTADERNGCLADEGTCLLQHSGCYPKLLLVKLLGSVHPYLGIYKGVVSASA